MLKNFLTSILLIGAVTGPHAWADTTKKPAPKKPTPASTPAAKEPVEDPNAIVAKVIEIKPVKGHDHAYLGYKQKNDKDFYQAFEAMGGKLHDQYRTDEQTVAALSFVLGGRVGINKGSVVEIVSERSVTDKTVTVNKIILRQGGIWAKVAKQTNPLLIQTNGGVMGIKGTEFVIESEPAGSTSIGVLEGQVAYTDKSGKETPPISPGQEYTTDSAGVTSQTGNGSVDDLREHYSKEDAWRDFCTAINVLEFFSRFTPIRGVAETAYYGDLAMALANHPGQVVTDRGFQEASNRLPISIPISNPFHHEPSPLFPTELKVDDKKGQDVVADSAYPHFSWRGVDDTNQYLVLVSSDAAGQQVEWSGRTRYRDIRMPSQARPLLPGRHYWHVVPMDDRAVPLQNKQTTVGLFTVRS